MMRRCVLIFWFCSVLSVALAEDKKILFPVDSLYELPQIFYKQGDTLIKWVEAGIKSEISSRHTPDFSARVKQLGQQYKIPLQEALRYGLAQETKESQNAAYEGIERWLAISDIHGQYGLFVELLKQHRVIDEELNWIFGNGHLVVNGDILDRGDGVTEALWLTFKLQQQATAQGGKVHYTMGNHELMVLDNDLRYMHKKYAATQEILGESYHEQFSEDAFFGKWIRRQTILFKMNEVGFVHAGISPDVVKQKLNPSAINRLFADSIFTQDKDTYRKSATLNLLARTNGPLWYRGYFSDSLESEDIDAILKWWGIDRMVIGHTSQKTITPLFDDRIIVIDSSIKSGRTGEVLIYEHGQFFRGLLDGSREGFLFPPKKR